jgi:transposase InsO family protein
VLRADITLVVAGLFEVCLVTGAYVESFFATLKRELIVGEKIRYRYQLREMVMGYIDRYYNQVRMHSTLDYKSPMESEKQ